MKIYDLSNVSHLEYDLNEIFERIDALYDVKFLANKTTISSRMILDKNVFWASPESTERFNSRIPQFKSLLKDMYSLVEATLRNKELFEPKQLEIQFKYFREFRLLNNQFKHFENRGVQIDLISTNILGGPNAPSSQEVLCQYRYEDGRLDAIPFSRFILLFFQILEFNGTITINRNQNQSKSKNG